MFELPEIKNLNVFITRDDNFLWYSLKKSKFSLFFFVYTPMRVSDVINNVDAQCLTCEMLERRQKKKKKKKKKKKISKLK